MRRSVARWWPYDTETFRWEPAFHGRLAHRVTLDAGIDEQFDAVAAIGAFDGLHLGHQELLRGARKEADRRGVQCVAVTFDPDPSEFFDTHKTKTGTRLLRCEDRVAGLLDLGADAVLCLSFDAELAHTEPHEFVDRFLLQTIRPISLHVGDNFRFGNAGAGDVALLHRIGNQSGFETRSHALKSVSGMPISATRARTQILEGHLQDANELLGRCHYVRGVVEHGRGEGTSFGFPTANVRCDCRDLMPPQGVYACYVIMDGLGWPAAVNVGAPPTFGGQGEAFLEANLLGYAGDLYGREVCVSFVSFLRPSRTFESVEELERVVLGNIDWVAKNLGDHALEVGM